LLNGTFHSYGLYSTEIASYSAEMCTPYAAENVLLKLSTSLFKMLVLSPAQLYST